MWSDYWSHFLKAQLLVVHGLGVLNAIHAALKVRIPQAALGWALALVTFPYFAIPLYWVFGRTKFIGYRRAATDAAGPLHAAAQAAASAIEPFSAESGDGEVSGKSPTRLGKSLPAQLSQPPQTRHRGWTRGAGRRAQCG
jgi:hypothetical protein